MITDLDPRYQIVPATIDHVPFLVAHLREEDRAEIEATGAEVAAAVETSISASLLAYVWLVDGEPACAFGCTTEDVLSGTGCPWLVTTTLINADVWSFLRHGRRMVGEMRMLFPALENYVHVANTQAIRWLTWLGFYIHPAAPYGTRGELFHRFTLAHQGLRIERVTMPQLEGNYAFDAMFNEYCRESRLAGLPAPDEKRVAYRLLDGSPAFTVFGAFLGSQLIGVLAVLAPTLPHYGVAVAVAESYFVVAYHRSSGAGLKLLRAAEKHARAIGSPGLLVSAPFGARLAKVLPRQGYRHTHEIFFKAMDHVE